MGPWVLTAPEGTAGTGTEVLVLTAPEGTAGTGTEVLVLTAPEGTARTGTEVLVLTAPEGTARTGTEVLVLTAPVGTAGTGTEVLVLIAPEGTTGPGTEVLAVASSCFLFYTECPGVSEALLARYAVGTSSLPSGIKRPACEDDYSFPSASTPSWRLNEAPAQLCLGG